MVNGKRGWTRRKNPFQPRLTLEHTGFSGNALWQWCLSFRSSSGRMATCGGPLLREADTPQKAWEHFREFLCKIGAKPA